VRFVFNCNVDCVTVTVHFFGFKETADVWHKRSVEYLKWLMVSDICFDNSPCTVPSCVGSWQVSCLATY
jgi:hypothetical protein